MKTLASVNCFLISLFQFGIAQMVYYFGIAESLMGLEKAKSPTTTVASLNKSPGGSGD